ncbi:MAG: hypothetical protein ACREOG_16105 [Gemmatimonadaceae bacterium]
MPDAAEQVSITRGTIIVYRVFDVAEEFDLRRIESDLKGPGGSARLKIARSTGHALILRDAPVLLALGAADLRLGQEMVKTEVFSSVWCYGVASLQFHVPIQPSTTWTALVERAACVEDDNDIDSIAASRMRELATGLAAAATLPHEPQGMEDYVVYRLEEVSGIERPGQLKDRVDIPALILGEPNQQLSDDIRRQILDNALAYSARDLAVIDWNSALLIEPEGSRDVEDMLEFAVTHLMEFRYFDTLLDERLAALYSAIERHHRFRSFFRSESDRLSHEASSLFIEFSEHVERIENSLKFVGDFYLATVFRRAAARFQLKEWEENVMRKVNALARISEVLSEETNVRRSHLLEIIIIVLILYEIVQAALSAGR